MPKPTLQMQYAQRQTIREWRRSRTEFLNLSLVSAWTPTVEAWEDYSGFCHYLGREPLGMQSWPKVLAEQGLLETKVLRTRCLPIALLDMGEE